jgi:hypothetical protein
MLTDEGITKVAKQVSCEERLVNKIASNYSTTESAKEKALNEVYRRICKCSDLLFGVDKDIEHLPEKRQRKQPKFESGAGNLIVTSVYRV